MKLKIQIISILMFFLGIYPFKSKPCTTFGIKDKSGSIYFGRNFDFSTGLGQVNINLKGVEKTSLSLLPEKPFSWTSKYGSITFNQNGREFPYGGMNELGLVIENMMLNSTQYPESDNRNCLEELQWIQYQLDVSATVEDVINSNKYLRISYTSIAPIHFSVADANGNFATIEYIKGKFIYHTGNNLKYRVLSNSTYDESVKYYDKLDNEKKKNIKNLSSLNRFSKAAYMIDEYNNENDKIIDYAFDVLKNVSHSGTMWSIVYDIKSKSIYYKTKENISIRKLDINSFDYSSNGKRLFVNIDTDKNSLSDFKEYNYESNYKLIDSAWSKILFLKIMPEELKQTWASYPEDLNNKNRITKRPATVEILNKSMKFSLKSTKSLMRSILSKKDLYIYSEDDLIKLGTTVKEFGLIKPAISIFEIIAETYPKSWKAYHYLAEIYAKAGKNDLMIKNSEKSKSLNPDKKNFIKYSAANRLYPIFKNSGFEKSKSDINKILSNSDEYYIDEYEFNDFGYKLLFGKKINDAIEIFKINVQNFPNSANVYDSLGEAYMKAGKKELAIKNYEKSLEINPKNTNAINMLKQLK